MARRHWSAAIAAIAVLAAMALIVWWAAASRPVQDDYRGHAASPSPSAAPGRAAGTPAAGTGPSGDPGDGDESAPRATTDSGGNSPDAGAKRPTWDPAGDAPAGAAEEAKVPDGLGAEPYRLPEAPERAPVLTSVPKAADASHALVKGFPEEAVPVPDGAEVQSSSIAPQGQRVIVGVTALSKAPAESLLDLYAAHCSALAWPVQQGTTPDGALSLDCGFGADRLTIRVTSLPTGVSSITATGAFGVED